ncbi:MAG: hypothetical protein ICV51_17530 [Flavisolibacter sp.]|nr:hypothetical protein [Flavisolibacter sp.]MBD0368897.1 hypothetical protein [Flavisolibacter sp.]MBD0377417.1 hypothetical protein [Flavisolibacter sp.]
MRKILFFFIAALIYQFSGAQKLETIKFNLYTDSLKKGFYNYINVDGKYSDGRWLPLDNNDVILTVQTTKADEKKLFFEGNSLFIDSSYTGEAVRVKVVVKSNPALSQEVIIYIRKRGFDEPLKTDEEILNEIKQGRKKPKQRMA